MTRKHYVAIAKAISNVRKEWGQDALDTKTRHMVEEIEDALAQVFKADNANFDKQRFLDACKA